MLHGRNVRFIFVLTFVLLIGLFFKSSKETLPAHAAELAQNADMSLVPIQNIKQVAIGNSHTCAVTVAGAVKCWGNNVYGQLGNGSRTTSFTPVDVTGLSEGVIAVSTGYFHTCALTSGGGVKCWGVNQNGQLGNNSVSDSTTPIDVTGLSSGVVAISAGSSHTCALTNNGGVKCWGANGDGRLGNGSKLASTVPVAVLGLTSGVLSISAGDEHTCAVTSVGSAKCWGYNRFGRLGNGDTVDSSVPVDVIGLSTGVLSISAGHGHTCAVLSAHTIKCWGENTNGELGNGSTTDSPTPVDVATINDGTTVISAGNGYTCVVISNGVKCWGRNSFGELGNGETADSSTPVDVVGLSAGVESVSAGLVDTCALLSSKTIKCWGRNESGQLGNDVNVHSSMPVSVISLSSEISTTQAGGNHTCLLTTAGDVKCWGWNFAGQLGAGNMNNYHTPVDVVSRGNSISSISPGDDHSCALTTAGGVQCWGYNGFGALGNDTTANSNMPVDVVGLGSGINAVSAGGKHTCALTITGGVKCWGWNTSGQLGNDSKVDSKVPVDVVGLDTGVAAISTGSLHTCALTTTGGVKCWGNNEYGELGNGSTTNSNTPVDVVGLDHGISAISAGGNFTCALTTSGSVKCWGWNEVGQLGNGGIANSNIPVDVTGLSSTAIAISTGGSHTCVLTTSGGVKCWGGNYHGKLGNGSVLNSRAPVNVVGLDSGVSVVSAGYAHTCAVTSTNAIKCWGDNTFGQLGDGLAWTTTPVDVVLHCYSLAVTHLGQGSDPIAAPDQSEVCVAGNYTSGTVVDFSALPSAGWQVASWSGTSQDASTGLTNTLIMPASNYTVSVIYSQIITATDTPTPTSTPTETPTDTSTSTPTQTETPVDTPTLTFTPTDTPTDTSTPTPTLTETPTDTPTLTFTPTETPTKIPANSKKALVLIYAVLDNDLQRNWDTLVNNVEQGVTAETDVRLFVDGPGSNDVYVYNVKHDEDINCPKKETPRCNYTFDIDLKRGDENSAHPATLTRFITESVALYPDDSQLILALVGHGSGWSAGVLPDEEETFIDQPRPWSGQPRPWSGQPGALLWDDHPSQGANGTHSLSIKGLDDALYFAQKITDHKIDLLYMDGCSLGMVEIAYEVKEHAHYMIASPNTDWATFTYNRLLAMVNPDLYDVRLVSENWLQTDVTYINGSSYTYPYTYALVDLTQMEGVATATTAFSDALIPLLASNKAGVLEAFLRADRYDSDYNELINEDDAYTDLNSFAYEIQQQFSEQPILQQAAADVRSALAAAIPSKASKSGVYWQSEDLWKWNNFGGLGIYLPLAWDEERRQYYNQDNIMWAYATTWDEFINEYHQATWVNVGALQLDRLPRPLETCAVTTDPSCAELAEPLVLLDAYLIYLPVISK